MAYLHNMFQFKLVITESKGSFFFKIANTSEYFIICLSYIENPHIVQEVQHVQRRPFLLELCKSVDQFIPN